MKEASWIAVALLTVFAAASAEIARAETAPPPYRVVNGRVDDAAYRGWRAYHSACHTCHGVDAFGTVVAPSLVERVRDLTAKQFTIKVRARADGALGPGEPKRLGPVKRPTGQP